MTIRYLEGLDLKTLPRVVAAMSNDEMYELLMNERVTDSLVWKSIHVSCACRLVGVPEFFRRRSVTEDTPDTVLAASAACAEPEFAPDWVMP